MFYEERKRASLHLGIFGSVGVGTHFVCKTEIRNRMKNDANYQVIIIDQTNEYSQEFPDFDVYEIDTANKRIGVNYNFFSYHKEFEDFFFLMPEFFQTVMTLMNNTILSPVELSLSDRYIRAVYKDNEEPTLKDFQCKKNDETSHFFDVIENIYNMIDKEGKSIDIPSSKNIIFKINNELDRILALKIVSDIARHNAKVRKFCSVAIPCFSMDVEPPEIVIGYMSELTKRARLFGVDIIITDYSYKRMVMNYNKLLTNLGCELFLKQVPLEYKTVLEREKRLEMYGEDFLQDLEPGKGVKVTPWGCGFFDVKDELPENQQNSQKKVCALNGNNTIKELQRFLAENGKLLNERFLQNVFDDIVGMYGYCYVVKEEGQENDVYNVLYNNTVVCNISVHHLFLNVFEVNVVTPQGLDYLDFLPDEVKKEIEKRNKKENMSSLISSILPRGFAQRSLMERAV